MEAKGKPMPSLLSLAPILIDRQGQQSFSVYFSAREGFADTERESHLRVATI